MNVTEFKTQMIKLAGNEGLRSFENNLIKNRVNTSIDELLFGSVYTSFKDLVFCAFPFAKTKEGFNYWFNVANGMAVINDNPITQTRPHHSRSDKYKFVSTADVIARFESRGWVVEQTSMSNARTHKGYQKHVVTMKPSGGRTIKVGDTEARLMIFNSHNGSSSLQIKMGLFRLVCANGLVVPNGIYEGVKLRHTGKDLEYKLDEALERIEIAAEKLNQLWNKTQRQITVEERKQLLRVATDLRHGEDQPLDPDMLTTNRPEDLDNTIWTVFNTLQENVIRGYYNREDERSVRGITSIDRQRKINEQLFDAAMKLVS
jgi:hypothetical protein